MLCERLKKCADFVVGDFVCDIGSDHALLPIYLVENGICKRALACDIADGPLESAKKNIKHSQLEHAIKTLKSDGLENVDANGITDVVIAGMGGETICGILSSEKANFLKNGVNLILQPQSKADTLRRFLAENGFETIREEAICEGKFNYAVICVRFCGIGARISDTAAIIGNIDALTEHGRKYISFQIERLQNAAKGLYASGNKEKADNFTKISMNLMRKLERKKMTISDIYDIIDAYAPFKTQEGYDNSGLIVGSFDSEVSKILLALDITADTVREAKQKGAQLIISHHPVIFNAIKRLDSSSVPYMLASCGIAAICSHTCLDMAKNGVNDVLFDMIAQPLGIESKGEIFENVTESTGYGAVCELKTAVDADRVAKSLKDVFGCTVVRYVEGSRKIKTIAYCSGSGGSLLEKAVAKGADALITGDIKHSVWIEAKNADISLFDCGHYHTEKIILPVLKRQILANTSGVEVDIADSDTDIVKYCL